MFNNPLKKYQSGGNVATSQQQQQIAKLFEAASKNTGIDVETLMSAANELKDEDSMKQYVEAISLAAQGDQTAITAIKKMFSQQSPATFAKGGKLWNFICKHAKGGHLAGCGCKEDGGKVEKNQTGSKIPEFSLKSINSRTLPNGQTLKETIIADNDGNAAKQSIVGRDTLSLGGIYDNGRFYNDGDVTYDNNILESYINKLKKANPKYIDDLVDRKDKLMPTGDSMLRNWQMLERTPFQGSYMELQNGGIVKGQGGLAKIGKAGARWIKSASGNRILVDDAGKVIMKEIVEGRSGATPDAAKILKHRDPFEVYKATDYADRMMIHREYNDFPWSIKQSAFEAIHPGESLFQPWKPRTIKVEIKNPTVESNTPIGKYNWNSASSVPDEKYMGLQIPDKYIK